ncbi:family 20 glycosylhydrolase [Tichowtungia aerotolerans]|uniref:beta-N-acetylhexosaminidase n=1 Tax=Tichowtungia aerotolerans TaxID=2697043 RepID=A0A6P1MCU1_9BACT|nr:family 20 glycosylhydrolase [Tichowtungia aerotolerans]QHI70394.1 family 20 glycosylhydrolase [Tichowtungia aerotolerans]
MKKILIAGMIVVTAISFRCQADLLAEWHTSGLPGGFKLNSVWKPVVAARIDKNKSRIKLDETKLKTGYGRHASRMTFFSQNTGSLAINRYLQLQIAPVPGATMALDRLVLNVKSAVGDGAEKIAVRSSVDNFSKNLLATDLVRGEEKTIRLELAEFDGIESVVEFRIYFWRATKWGCGYLEDLTTGEGAVQIFGKVNSTTNDAVLLQSDVGVSQHSLIPWPKEISFGSGMLEVKSGTSICIQNNKIQPLAEVFQKELAHLFGLDLAIIRKVGSRGDVLLEIDPMLEETQYRIIINDQVVVKGGSYSALAFGTVTVGQLMEQEKAGGSVQLSKAVITDSPDCSYRGLMVDLARKWHPVDAVKQLVDLCRWYKINYLHLHFTDNQSWTLPSKIQPMVSTPARHYTFSELYELEHYASSRGVTIVPEIDVPGHSRALIQALPDYVAISHQPWSAISAGREEAYDLLDELIGEVCEIFSSTPYFHIGADEVKFEEWERDEFAMEYMKKNGIEDLHDLYHHFIVRMNEIVKSHGKQTIVWEGFKLGGRTDIPKDVIVMPFESYYEDPRQLAQEGYTIINTSWKPLYIVNKRRWSPEEIYQWNIYRWENWSSKSLAINGLEVSEKANVIGAQICAWEQSAEAEIPSIRKRLAALSERVWNIYPSKPVEDFLSRLDVLDHRFSLLNNQ